VGESQAGNTTKEKKGKKEIEGTLKARGGRQEDQLVRKASNPEDSRGGVKRKQPKGRFEVQRFESRGWVRARIR